VLGAHRRLNVVASLMIFAASMLAGTHEYLCMWEMPVNDDVRNGMGRQ